MSAIVSFKSSIQKLSWKHSVSFINCVYLNQRPFSAMPTETARQHAQDYIDYVHASPTPYHAVKTAKQRLDKAGFKQIKERDPWGSTVVPGGKYYTTRNASTIVAFAVGKKWKPGNPISIVGSHVDSCVLRLKPVSKRQADGYLQFGVECYGGGLWATWFDRDLGVAGRVMCRTKDGGIEQKEVNLERPIARVPSLAPHFGKSVPFEFNKETQLFPIAGLVEAELNRTGQTAEDAKKDDKSSESADSFSPVKPMSQRHHPYLLELIAKDAGVSAEDVIDFELILYDIQKPSFGGLKDEFVLAARQDNLGMTYCALEGLIRSTSPSGVSLDNDNTIRMIAGFDHEEIGSTSAQGANSSVLPSIVRRLSCLPVSSDAQSDASYDRAGSETTDTSTAYEQTLATSFMISADMTHGINPNYAGMYEGEHKPHINKGVVIKVNANQRYATNSPGIALLQEAARKAKRGPSDKRTSGEGVPLQYFVAKNDMPCGSTIG